MCMVLAVRKFVSTTTWSIVRTSATAIDRAKSLRAVCRVYQRVERPWIRGLGETASGTGKDDFAGTRVVSRRLRSEAPAATVLHLRRTKPGNAGIVEGMTGRM